jgi:hypothetical protein
MPNAVQTAVTCFEINSEIAMVHGNCSTIDENGNEINPKIGSPVKFKEVLNIGMLPNIYQPSCFFNKNQLKRDYFLDTKFHYAFDYELILYILKNRTSFYTNMHMAAYRVHGKAKSQNVKAAFKEKLQVQWMYMKGINLKWIWRKFKTTVFK